MTISDTSTLRVPSDVMVSEIGGEAVLLNLSTEQYFGLNDVGAGMWAAIRDSDSVQQAMERLLREYDVDKGRLQADFHALLEKLVDHGLLEVESNVA